MSEHHHDGRHHVPQPLPPHQQRPAAQQHYQPMPPPAARGPIPTAQPPQQLGYGPPPEPRNGLGLAAAIIAPIGILFGLVPLTGFVAVILALVAIPLALVGWSRVRKGRATNRKTTLTGLVAGVAALALGIWGMTIVFNATSELVSTLDGAAPVAPGAAAPPLGQETPLGTPPPVTTAGFGERITYDNGLAVEVSQPEAFSPGQYAAGHDAARAISVTVTVHNGTAEGFDAITTMVNATHGGQQVSNIFSPNDGGTENPQGTVLPGKSMTFTVALSLPQDVADLQVEVTPGFMNDPAIFTGEV